MTATMLVMEVLLPLMNWTVTMDALLTNLNALIQTAFLLFGGAMAMRTVWMGLMKQRTVQHEFALKAGGSATRLDNAFRNYGFVMERTTVEMPGLLMNILNEDVTPRHVTQVSSSVRTSSVSFLRFIVMVMMTVETDLTNPSIVSIQSVVKTSSNA